MDESALSECLGELKTDVRWIKEKFGEADKTYAKKWVEKVQWIMLTGALGWTVTQVMNLIQTANAFFN